MRHQKAMTRRKADKDSPIMYLRLIRQGEGNIHVAIQRKTTLCGLVNHRVEGWRVIHSEDAEVTCANCSGMVNVICEEFGDD
jgi:hypothetical protein